MDIQGSFQISMPLTSSVLYMVPCIMNPRVLAEPFQKKELFYFLLSSEEVFVKYLFLNNWICSFDGELRMSHACFAKKAYFCSSRVLNPRPPCFFRVQRDIQAFVGFYFCLETLFPTRNLPYASPFSSLWSWEY